MKAYFRILIVLLLAWTTLAPFPIAASAAPVCRHERPVKKKGHDAHPVWQKYWHKMDSLARASRLASAQSADTLLSPFAIGMVGGAVLFEDVVRSNFSLSEKAETDGQYISSSSDLYEWAETIDREALSAYTAHPQLVSLYEERGYAPDAEGHQPPLPPHDLSLTDYYKDRVPQEPGAAPVFTDEDYTIVARKPNFWTFKENISIQFTQSHVSDNWYKGGESHNALLASTVLEANFNNQRKITFDNKLEMKLGFQTSHNDEEHKYKTNSDLLRLTNKFGYRAVKHWYYTVMLQSWTQFYRGYKANDPKVYSDFMSPFESLLSIGMDYQQTTKKERFKITATLSPLALKFKYVGRPSLITSFGLDEGKHTLWEYGSNITVNYTWNIIKNISWVGRIYYFTDYSSSQIEWENTFNLTINKYLSAKLFLYPRFDDSRQRKDDETNFEFNELLSLGLNLNF